jgi:hypothetical protein
MVMKLGTTLQRLRERKVVQWALAYQTLRARLPDASRSPTRRFALAYLACCSGSRLARKSSAACTSAAKTGGDGPLQEPSGWRARPSRSPRALPKARWRGRAVDCWFPSFCLSAARISGPSRAGDRRLVRLSSTLRARAVSLRLNHLCAPMRHPPSPVVVGFADKLVMLFGARKRHGCPSGRAHPSLAGAGSHSPRRL